MNAFEWRQEGNAVRIRDADGSIYVGGVVPDPARAPGAASQALAAKATPAPSASIRLRARAAAPANQESSSQNVFSVLRAPIVV